MIEKINIADKNGVLVVSSREVASNFKKEHNKVLKSIENCQNRQPSQNWFRYFILNEYKDEEGETKKEYLLTRDGFSFLVMGFNGVKADRWKLKYIEAFNKMEECIKGNHQILSCNFKKTLLQQLLVEVEEKEKLQKIIKELMPKVEFVKAIVSNQKSIDVGSMAKILYQTGINIGRNRLFVVLREKGFLMSSGDNTIPTQKSMNLGVMEIKLGHYQVNGESKIYLKPMITTKGQVYFVDKFMKGELA